MTAPASPQPRDAPRRPAFSMVEAVFSLLLVSGVMVAALNTVGASFTARRGIGDRARGQMLANDLMAEILAQAYEEPVDAVAFGPESGETGADRSAFDDVDDYRNYSEPGVMLKNGTAVSEFSEWSRVAVVVRVDPDNPSNIAIAETGAKRIVLTVKRGATTMATLTAVKTSASPPAGGGRKGSLETGSFSIMSTE